MGGWAKTDLQRDQLDLRILFVCVENAGRSQMAEAFAREIAPPGTEIVSAGSRPAKEINPVVVQVLRERKTDVSCNRPKSLAELPGGIFDLVVGMGCGDACPTIRAGRTLSWEIPDPKGQPIEAVRKIRDEIQEKVRALFQEIRKGSLPQGRGTDKRRQCGASSHMNKPPP